MSNNVFVIRCKRVGRKKAYLLYFPYNTQLVDKIKNLPIDHRKWKAKEKVWEVRVPGLLKLLEFYRKSNKIYFDFGSDRDIFIKQIEEFKKDEKERKKLIVELEEKKKHWIDWKILLEKNYSKYSSEVHSNLKEGIQLYPHQIVAACYLNQVRNALISHDMGIGKTLSSIAYVEMNDFQKVLVITPNSLKHNYYNEVEKFTNSKAHIFNWKKNKYSLEESKYIIVNYEYFSTGDKKRMNKKWDDLKIDILDVVISDESHRLKSSKSNIYNNYNKFLGNPNTFRNKKPSRVFLTGTPAPNRAYELYTVLNQISPLDFPTKSYFYEYYLGMRYNYEDEDSHGWESFDKPKLEELYYKISPYTHRKKKEEVLTDLPDLIHQKIILEMSKKDMDIYDEIESGIANEFVKEPNKNPLSVLTRLRQYTSHLKVKEISELIDNIIETGEKVVVIDMFKESLYKLHEKYKNISGLHTGDQTVEERSEIVKEFQDPNSKMKIFFGTSQTCNYGLTLTEANKIFVISLPYVPGEYNQIASRCHRIGQKNVVNLYALIFPKTIDEHVYSTIEEKTKEISKVIDNEEYTSDVDSSILSEVIEKIKRKHGE